MFFVTISLVLFATYMQGSSACTCMSVHSQENFCKAAYALKGTVIDVYRVPRDGNTLIPLEQWNKFTLTVDEIYRGDDVIGVEEGGEVVIESAADGSLCGTLLNNNTEYFITGTIGSTGTLYTDLCGWHRRFNRLTETEIEGIQGKYDCDCKVLSNTHSDGNSDDVDDNRKCDYGGVLSSDPANRGECTPAYQHCSKDDEDNCRWEC